MKDEIKEFLRTIPNIYLDDVFEALEEVCEERGLDKPVYCNQDHEGECFSNHSDLTSAYDDWCIQIDEANEKMEKFQNLLDML